MVPSSEDHNPPQNQPSFVAFTGQGVRVG